jgi:hypothetical protein
MRACWQVTGIRQDPWANAHAFRWRREGSKAKGLLPPSGVVWGPNDKAIEWARHPE